MKRSLFRVLTLLSLVSAALAARADVVDFESDTVGFKGNGFQSASSSNVTFSILGVGSPSVLNSLFGNSDGKGLTATGLGYVWMDFSQTYNALSLTFGNDFAALTLPGEQAVLELYSGGSLVSSVSLALNRNGLADQTIAYSGAAFDGALFRYASPLGAFSLAPEKIDNVTFSRIVSVPGPAAAAAFALGLLRRRRRATA